MANLDFSSNSPKTAFYGEGEWRISGIYCFNQRASSLWTTDINASCTYKPSLLKKGLVKISVYKILAVLATEKQQYEIHHINKIDIATVDFSIGSSCEFVELGVFDFSATEDEFVRFVKTKDLIERIAEVRFEYLEDNSIEIVGINNENIHIISGEIEAEAENYSNIQEIILPNVFNDYMVLQRNKPIKIWGKAPIGEVITISFAGKTISIVADNPDWSVSFDAMPCGGPFELSVLGSKNQILIKEIMIGDVYLISGQSNMEWSNSNLGNKSSDGSCNEKIRFFVQEKKHSKQPYWSNINGKWLLSSSENAAFLSAVGYYFADEINKAYNVPIGILSCAVGGKKLTQFLAGDNAVSSYFNTQIHPLKNLCISGALWYQGESDFKDGLIYRDIFPELICQWRELFNKDDLPFVFVQLPNFDINSFVLVREAQLLTLNKLKNVAMVVTLDVGEPYNIHPKEKKPVGHRLALAIKALVYNENIEYMGPIFRDYTYENNCIIVKFSHTSGGLKLEDNKDGCFEICGLNFKFSNASAQVIDENTIKIFNDKIKNPIAARYAFSPNPIPCLYNGVGLLASPFRTDIDTSVEV